MCCFKLQFSVIIQFKYVDFYRNKEENAAFYTCGIYSVVYLQEIQDNQEVLNIPPKPRRRGLPSGILCGCASEGLQILKIELIFEYICRYMPFSYY